MDKLIDWGFYSSLFTNASENDFPRLLSLAEYKLDTVTNARWRIAEGYKLERVKYALAHLVDLLAIKESNPIGIKAASNDGYSETYATAEEFNIQIKSAVFDDLSGTGLMGVL